MKYDGWKRLRTRMHHRWLQNRYLTFLEALDGRLAGGCLTISERAELIEELLQWENTRSSFETLINSAEEALSPKQLLDESPLNILAEEDRKWLGEVIHELYCMRTGIREKLRNLEAMLQKIDMAVMQMEKKLQGTMISKDEITGEEMFQMFTLFSKAISALPQEIQIA